MATKKKTKSSKEPDHFKGLSAEQKLAVNIYMEAMNRQQFSVPTIKKWSAYFIEFLKENKEKNPTELTEDDILNFMNANKQKNRSRLLPPLTEDAIRFYFGERDKG